MNDTTRQRRGQVGEMMRASETRGNPKNEEVGNLENGGCKHGKEEPRDRER